MENVVSMSLEEYKKLIVENTNLKFKLEALKKKAYDRAFDEIKDSNIDRIPTIDDCQKILSFSADTILSNYASAYTWTWRSIANDSYGIVSEEEIKEIVAGEIRKRVNDKCNELIDKEKDGQE